MILHRGVVRKTIMRMAWGKWIALGLALGCSPGDDAYAKWIPATSNSLPRLATPYGTFALGKKPYPAGTRAKWIGEGRALARAPEGAVPRSKALKGAADNRAILPPIRSQGGEGSCVHWAGAYYVKTASMKRMDPTLNVAATSNQYSPRFTYNLTNAGEDNGGWGHEPFEIFMRYGGASLRQKPYVAGQYAELPTLADFVEGLHRRTASYVWVWEWNPTATEIAELKAHLEAGGVAACGVYAEDSFDAWGPGDAPWVGPICLETDVNHMVTVCGYGPGYYLVANSWGTGFGSNGFIVVDADYFENYFSDVMYPVEGSYAPATNYAQIQIQHDRRSDLRGLSFTVNGALAWSNAPTPKTAPLGGGSYDVDERDGLEVAVDLSAAPWAAANVVTARCQDRVRGTTGTWTNFALVCGGTRCVSPDVPVAVPDNSAAGASATATVAFAGAAARPWPDTSERIVPFADQLPEGLTATQRWFAATHFAGTQKMRRSEIRALRACNPDFLCLHYQLAVGAGPAEFIVGDEWASDWAYLDAQTNWFLLTAGGARVHQTQWNWDLMDVRYAAGEAVSGFPDYWIRRCIERLAAAEDDGVFADSFTPDAYGFGQCDPSHPWLEDVDLCLANWVPSLEQFGAEARAALAAAGYVFLPNLGGLVTSWLDMDYGLGDGGMIEGFAFWGPDSPFDPADWELQMERTLALARSNKIVICQAYPGADSAQERMFATASYLLVKGARTYLNLLSSADVALEYYPEYQIDLGGARGAFPSGLAALWDEDWGVYRRDYDKGVAVANPTAAEVRVPNLGATYWRVAPSGGGVVAETGEWDGALAAIATTNLTLPAFSGAVLLYSNESALAISPLQTNVPVGASTGRSIVVTANQSWTALAQPAWLSISSGATGAGNGTVIFAVAANDTGLIRTGAIAVTGGGLARTCTVVQAAGTASVGDFDGDGAADAATYRPTNGNWGFLYSGGGGATTAFGWSATVPVPADYDGDGTVDLAVYHPAGGKWYVRQSSAGDRVESFGWSATIPLPGDYDGDGRADLAVFYRPTARWYFRYSQSGTDYNLAYGWSAVVPVPADYDGNGAVEIAAYHPASGNWYLSSGGVVHLGGGKAVPVPADYDGDGKADCATFTRANGTWQIAYSGGGGLAQGFGWSATVPVPADYDGDGQADLAVYHPAGGKWYVLSSETGATLVKSLGGTDRQPVLLNSLIHAWFKM